MPRCVSLMYLFPDPVFVIEHLCHFSLYIGMASDVVCVFLQCLLQVISPLSARCGHFETRFAEDFRRILLFGRPQTEFCQYAFLLRRFRDEPVSVLVELSDV